MDTQTLTHSRAGQTFVFRYREGFEQRIVDAITDCAADPDCPLTWVDAAMLSFKVTRSAAAWSDTEPDVADQVNS